MAGKKGFTLIEIIVVMVIIGILAIIAIPNYNNMIIAGSQQATLNNMNIVLNAQKIYYLNNGQYCLGYNATPASPNCRSIAPDCGSSLAALNCNLGLNVVDNNHSYICECGNDGRNASTGWPGWNSCTQDLECEANGNGADLVYMKVNGQVDCQYLGNNSSTVSPYCPNPTLTLSL